VQVKTLLRSLVRLLASTSPARAFAYLRAKKACTVDGRSNRPRSARGNTPSATGLLIRCRETPTTFATVAASASPIFMSKLPGTVPALHLDGTQGPHDPSMPRRRMVGGPTARRAGGLGTSERNVRFGHLVIESPRYHKS
jgi:hypothetical protein